MSATALILALTASRLPATPSPDAISGHYYERESETRSWDEARVDAMGRILLDQPGHLVAIGGVRENAIVEHLGGSLEKWIGLTDSEATSTIDSFDHSSLGTSEAGDTSDLPLPEPGMEPAGGERGAGFQWLTTEPFTYHNWRAGTPADDFGADGVYMIVSGEWQDNPGGGSIGQPGPFGPVLRQSIIEWETELEQERFRIVERSPSAGFNGGTGSIPALASAEALLALPAGHPDIAREERADAFVISFHDPDLGGGLFDYVRSPLLLDVVGTNDDNIAWRATAWVAIPGAGDWTFAVAAGDTFRLEVGGNSFVGNGTLPANPPVLTRASTGTLVAVAGGSGDAFHFPAAGLYPLTLTGFESDFFAFNQLFAAEGAQADFDAEQFDLVGDEWNGGLALAIDPLDVMLRIAPAPGGSGYRLNWNGVPGMIYRVEFSPDTLADPPAWSEISGDIPGMLPENSFDHDPDATRGFYRLVLAGGIPTG